ncbi:41615_t:CDS:2, partial [Gigaspora margarita]
MKFQCTKCKRTFSHRDLLRNYMKVHNNTIEKLLQEIAKTREREQRIQIDQGYQQNEDQLTIEMENKQLDEIRIVSQLGDYEDVENDEGVGDNDVENDESSRDKESGRGNKSGRNDIESRIDNQLVDENNYEDQLESQLKSQSESEMEESKDQIMSLDITNSINEELRFPSEEFGNFVKLLVKWNLSDAYGVLKFAKKISNNNLVLPTSVKQGRQFLDQMTVLHLSFKKVPIMTYKEETYYLNYHFIFDAIKELQLNIYSAMVLDKMHYLDLGLFNYQVVYTRKMLKELCEQAAINELDQCLLRIPRFLVLKSFREGLKNIKQFTADEASNKRDATGQIIQVVSRNSTIKYLFNCKKSELIVRQCHKKISMNSLLGSFILETADNFFAFYKAKKDLAPEALLFFEHFFSSLNKFFDLFEDLTEDIVIGNTSIKWYSYTNMVENEDYIRASSEFYNKLVFSDVSINMNPEESGDYNTDNGNCYCKNNCHLYKYDCPLLELSGIFDFVPVESIIEL